MAVMLHDLADICRDAGLTVIEVDGWRTRGHGEFDTLQTVVCHHTAGKRYDENYPSLATVRDGRTGLPGPLSQLGLGRDGTVYVIAAGVAWHAGAVTSTAYNNWHSIGIEAENDGIGEPWPEAQLDAYARLCWALASRYGLRVMGHKEICDPPGRKIDPTFDMDDFRTRVGAVGKDDDMADPTIPELLAAQNKLLIQQNQILAKTYNVLASLQRIEAREEQRDITTEQEG